MYLSVTLSLGERSVRTGSFPGFNSKSYSKDSVCAQGCLAEGWEQGAYLDSASALAQGTV